MNWRERFSSKQSRITNPQWSYPYIFINSEWCFSLFALHFMIHNAFSHFSFILLLKILTEASNNTEYSLRNVNGQCSIKFWSYEEVWRGTRTLVLVLQRSVKGTVPSFVAVQREVWRSHCLMMKRPCSLDLTWQSWDKN